MSQIITAEGLLAAPGQSNENANIDEQTELTNDDEDALLYAGNDLSKGY